MKIFNFFFNTRIIFILNTLIFQVFISFLLIVPNVLWQQHVLIILLLVIIFYQELNFLQKRYFYQRGKKSTFPYFSTDAYTYNLLNWKWLFFQWEITLNFFSCAAYLVRSISHATHFSKKVIHVYTRWSVHHYQWQCHSLKRFYLWYQ